MNKDIKNYIEEYEMICYQIDAYEKQINDLRIILDKKNRNVRRANRLF